MKKKVAYSELMYVIGMLTLALGTALMEKADYGMSMVVAPAYLVYLKLSTVWSFFTFGMAEYAFQALLLIILGIVLRKFKPVYLLSFITAVLYGFTLDACMALVALTGEVGTALRIVYYIVGMALGSLGVACMFRTYLTPEAYELFVRELSAKFGIAVGKFKTVYDCVSCLAAVGMSFAFFGLGHFEGVKWGTIVCALVNGWLIARICGIFDRQFEFRDALPLRKRFE